MASNRDNTIFEKTSFLYGNNSPFIKETLNGKVVVIGNTNLSQIKTIMIGIRNAPDSWRDYLYWHIELDRDD